MRTVTDRNNRQQAVSPVKASPSRRPGSIQRFKKKFHTSLRLLLLLILLLAIWIVYIQWKVQNGADQRSPEKADVGIVLGASLRKDLPSPGLKERLDYALELYKQGKFQNVIVTGGLDHNGSKLTEGEGMRNYLADHGIPETHIFVEPEATSTYENLLYSKRIMDKQGFISSIIVTHHFHGSRSLDIARTIGLYEPAVLTTDSKALFLPYHEARETLAYMKWEWTKLLYNAGLLPDVS